MNAFCADLTRVQHVPFYIYQQYVLHYTVNWNWRIKNLFCWYTKLHASTFYTSTTKFIYFPYSIHPYRYRRIWIWKYARTITTTVTSAMFIKLTCRFAILTFYHCRSLLSWFASNRTLIISWVKLACKHKGVLEEIFNLLYNTLHKNKLMHYMHLDVHMLALHFKPEVPHCKYVN